LIGHRCLLCIDVARTDSWIAAKSARLARSERNRAADTFFLSSEATDTIDALHLVLAAHGTFCSFHETFPTERQEGQPNRAPARGVVAAGLGAGNAVFMTARGVHDG